MPRSRRSSDAAARVDEDQRAAFDELVLGHWDTYRDEAWDRTRRYEVEQILARCTPRSVLNLGCGSGFQDVLLAEHEGVERVLGVDYSAASVATADRKHPHPLVTRKVADFYELEAGEHDLVTSFQVIEHLADQARFVGLCAAQARPGGTVAIVMPNARRAENRLRALFGRPPVWCDLLHLRELSAAELVELGVAAGLTPVATFAHTFDMVVPIVRRRLVPASRSLEAGARWAWLASTVGVVFRR